MLKVLSDAGFIVMIAGIVGLLATHQLFSPSPVTIVLQVASVLLMVWARITFGRRSFHAGADPTSGGLVTTGPYHYIRHPIYTAVCLFAWSGAVANLSMRSVALTVLLTAGAAIRMLCEEKLVVERYPEYREYARQTKRMIPYTF